MRSNAYYFLMLSSVLMMPFVSPDLSVAYLKWVSFGLLIMCAICCTSEALVCFYGGLSEILIHRRSDWVELILGFFISLLFAFVAPVWLFCGAVRYLWCAVCLYLFIKMLINFRNSLFNH